MSLFIKKTKQEIGVAPDDLIFRGEKKIEDVLLRVIDFDSSNLTEISPKKIDEIAEYQHHKKTVTWVNIDGLHDTRMMKEIAATFNLDTLVLAEVLNTEARPRYIEFDNCSLISLKMIQHNPSGTTVENLSLILTENVLISFQEKKGDVFEPVRDRIRKKKKRIINGGIDYLTFALIDIVIDNYLHIISLLGEEIEFLEEKIALNKADNIINEINKYKRELFFLRKSVKPAKEMIFSLNKSESDFICENTFIHFKELEDNISLASEVSDDYREMLSDQLNIYHTTISSKLNDIMRLLTVFSVIFIPLTFIAGIYGTNFDYIPELKYRYSYFIMWAAMVFVTILMLFYFKKKKWI